MRSRLNTFRLWMVMFACIMIPQLTLAQTQQIVTGEVLDEAGEPLIGVTVQLKGGSVGTVTDINGHYSLSVPDDGTIVFTYVGYKTEEASVRGRMQVDVRLQPDSQTLEETVVVAYGAQKKATITGSLASVSGEELLKSPVGSLGNAIAGKLPGVQTVQYSGAPGADGPSIYIRGIATFNNASPLVMVDGVERSFTQLDANEVENITILKDASATAVYGVRGANGVILVTTKRGEEGRTRINVSSSFSIQQVSDFVEMVDSYTWASLYNNAQLSDGTSSSQLRFSDEALQHFKDGDMPMIYPNVNWIDYVMKNTAPQSQHNVSLSGGNKVARYFVSVGFLTQEGLLRTFSQDENTNFSYKRYNYRANVDLTLDKRNELSINLGGRLQDRYELGEGETSAFSELINATPFSGYGLDEEGRHIKANKSYVGDYDNDGLDAYYGRGYNNEVTNVLNLDLIYKLKLDFITQGLDFKLKGSYNSESTQIKSRTLYEGVTYEPQLTSDGSVALVKSGDAWNLGYDESYSYARDWYVEASFNYARKFGHHDFTGLLLYNQSKTYYPSEYTDIPHGYVGLVGRVTYNYDMKYLAEFNAGYNGSENFAPGRRYGFFPSFSLGWIASEEKFWKPLERIVPYFKIRFSWGKVGSDDMNGARFLYLPGTYTINAASGYNFGLSNWTGSAYESTAGNPNVTWETATKKNIGVDMKFFDNKLSANLDFFFEDRKDILLSNEASIHGVTALLSSSENLGRVKNHGYEITLGWTDTIGKDFRYTISPSVTYARSEVIENGEVAPLYSYLSSIGYPVGQRFGYEFFEFYDPGVTEQRYLEKYGTEMPTQMVDVKAGDCVYVDLNDDGVIDENDMHAMYYSDVPEYNFSCNVNLQWKGFEFSMLWVGATNVTRNLQGVYRNQFGQMNRSGLLQWVADNSWTPETADTAILPRLSFTSKSNNTVDSSVYYADASYIRLKNVEVAYNFKKLSFAPWIKGLRIYFTGYNLLTFAKFKANDPESATSEVNYPITRVYNFGLNVTF